MEHIKISIENNIANLRLNRPDSRNALSSGLRKDLIKALAELNADDNVIAVLISGEGKVFCAGADISEMKASADKTDEENLEDARLLAQCFAAFYQFEKPIIASIHGACMGGANGIIACCDYVLAERETIFSFSEVKLGLIPATISQYVCKRIGEFNSRHLMISGKRFSTSEALSVGLINVIASKEMMYIKTIEYLEELQKNGPQAMKDCKKLINNIFNVWDKSEIGERSIEEIARIRSTTEAQEGLSAFIEKRKPNWRKD